MEVIELSKINNRTESVVKHYVEANKSLFDAMNAVWVLLCAFLVISMQLGFAMLEVGSCREAHRMTVLAKNVLDSAVSCVGFWFFIGFVQLDVLTDDRGNQLLHITVFFWGFCATCVTICSGSIAERAHMFAYICYALAMSTLIFPILAESAWGQDEHSLLFLEFHGRLKNGHDYHDFAGSGIVHVVGGIAALVGNVLVGRRILQRESTTLTMDDLKDFEGRNIEPVLCPDGGWLRRFDNIERDNVELKSCAYLQAMGMFILWVGWYGFNAGSTLAVSGGGAAIASRVAWNTTLAAASGGVGTYLYCYCIRNVLDVGFICNGVIASLVAITGACDIATERASVMIGLSAGLFLYPVSSSGLQLLRLDDPVDAIPVHLICGIFGVLAVGLCTPDCRALFAKPLEPGESDQEWIRFCSDEHSVFSQLLAQLWGVFVEIVYTGAICGTVFGVFATSEIARAVEAEHLANADRIICDMVAGAPQSKIDAECTKAVERSPVVRKILVEHGWSRTCFQDGTPDDVWGLRNALRGARSTYYETALEYNDRRRSPVAVLGRAIGCTPFVRRLAVLRLRISPSSEVSGLGVANIDGGSFLKAVLRTINSRKPLEDDTASSHAEIENKVRELSAIITRQDTLLRNLFNRNASQRSPNSGTPAHVVHSSINRTPLDNVPEGSPLHSVSEGCSLHHVPEGCAPPSNVIGAADAPEMSSQGFPVMFGTAASTTNSDSTTVSGARVRNVHTASALGAAASSTNSDTTTISGGTQLTPRSDNDFTPPPSLMAEARGARTHGRPRRQDNDQSLQILTQAAVQIARAVESQQQMLQRLHSENLPSSRSSHSSRPFQESASHEAASDGHTDQL